MESISHSIRCCLGGTLLEAKPVVLSKERFALELSRCLDEGSHAVYLMRSRGRHDPLIAEGLELPKTKFVFAASAKPNLKHLIQMRISRRANARRGQVAEVDFVGRETAAQMAPRCSRLKINLPAAR